MKHSYDVDTTKENAAGLTYNDGTKVFKQSDGSIHMIPAANVAAIELDLRLKQEWLARNKLSETDTNREEAWPSVYLQQPF